MTIPLICSRLMNLGEVADEFTDTVGEKAEIGAAVKEGNEVV